MRGAILLAVVSLCSCKEQPHQAEPRVQKATPVSTGDWSIDALPRRAQVNALAGSSATDVWAVGDKAIFHFDGKTWSDATPAGFDCSGCTLQSIRVVAPDDAWAVGDNGHVAHYDGKAWTVSQVDLLAKRGFTDTYQGLSHVEAWKGEVWASVTFGGGLVRFDGKAWSHVPQPDTAFVRGFWGATPDELWIAGKIVQRYQGGKWTRVLELEMSEWLTAVHGVAANDVWMVGTDGSRSALARIRHYDGTEWKPVDAPSGARSLSAVYAASASEVYAVGLSSTVVVWDGKAWTSIAVPPQATGTLSGVYSPGSGELFICGLLDGSIAHRRRPSH